MSMTKKDFEILADHINQWSGSVKVDELEDGIEWASYVAGNRDMLDAFCKGFKKVNPRFDVDKFFEACTK